MKLKLIVLCCLLRSIAGGKLAGYGSVCLFRSLFLCLSFTNFVRFAFQTIQLVIRRSHRVLWVVKMLKMVLLRSNVHFRRMVVISVDVPSFHRNGFSVRLIAFNRKQTSANQSLRSHKFIPLINFCSIGDLKTLKFQLAQMI